jgi:hypothetical protein
MAYFEVALEDGSLSDTYVLDYSSSSDTFGMAHEQSSETYLQALIRDWMIK